MKRSPRPRRGSAKCCRTGGFALLATLLALVVLATLASQLAMVTATEGMIAEVQARNLAHALAVDSAVQLTALKLRQDDPRFQRDLERDRFAVIEFTVGPTAVHVILQNDQAKWDVSGYRKPEQMPGLFEKLRLLARKKSLPAPKEFPRPILYEDQPDGGRSFACLEQLLPAVPAAAIYHLQTGAIPRNLLDVAPGWSDYLTVFGNGSTDATRMDPELLEIVLGEARPGQGSSSQVSESTPAPRFAGSTGRHALTIRTRIGSDVRDWYVVAAFDGQRSPEIGFRGAVTW